MIAVESTGRYSTREIKTKLPNKFIATRRLHEFIIQFRANKNKRVSRARGGATAQMRRIWAQGVTLPAIKRITELQTRAFLFMVQLTRW